MPPRRAPTSPWSRSSSRGRSAERLVAISRQMGLLVAGIDLRLTAEGVWFCFEINPSPGFTFYEDATVSRSRRRLPTC